MDSVWWDTNYTFLKSFFLLLLSFHNSSNLINNSQVFHHFFLELFAKWIFNSLITMYLSRIRRFPMFNYFSNHTVRFILMQQDTHRPCLIFRDGTVGLSGFHLKFGPRIISSFSWLKMTRIHLGFANDQLQLNFWIKIRDGFLKTRRGIFTFVLLILKLSWSFPLGQNKKEAII